MSALSNDTALFIDGANLYATAKALGFDIDYRRLLKEFQSRGTLLRAFYYTAIIEDQEFTSIRPLIDWLDYNGYTVVTKATKEFIDASGRRKVKGNMDLELGVEAHDQGRCGEWLGQEANRSGRQRSGADPFIGKGRDEDKRHIITPYSHRRQQVQTAHHRHLHIRDHAGGFTQMG